MHQPGIMNNHLHVNEIFSSFQGEGMLAGYRQIFIRLTECNLECRYCDTEFARTDFCRVESSPGDGEFVSVEQPLSLFCVSNIISDWLRTAPGAHHSISLTGGEPLLCADQLVEWLPALRRLIPVHLETNGTMHLALERVVGELDYISMDMKLPSTSGCTEDLWELHNLFLTTASRCRVSVKIVVSNETTMDEISRTCNTIINVNAAVPLFIQPVTNKDGSVSISMSQLFHIQTLASSILPDVRVIPQMHKLLGVL